MSRVNPGHLISPGAERMDDPFHKEWFEFCRGLTTEQTDTVIRGLDRRGRQVREGYEAEIERLRREVEFLRDALKRHGDPLVDE